MEPWPDPKFAYMQTCSKDQILVNNYTGTSDGNETRTPADTSYPKFNTPGMFQSQEFGFFNQPQFFQNPANEYIRRPNTTKYSDLNDGFNNQPQFYKYQGNEDWESKTLRTETRYQNLNYEKKGMKVAEYSSSSSPVSEESKNRHGSDKRHHSKRHHNKKSERLQEDSRRFEDVNESPKKPYISQKRKKSPQFPCEYQNNGQEGVRVDHAGRRPKYNKRNKSDSSSSSRSSSSDHKKRKHEHKRKHHHHKHHDSSSKKKMKEMEKIIALLGAKLLDDKEVPKKPKNKKNPEPEIFPYFPGDLRPADKFDEERRRLSLEEQKDHLQPASNKKLNIPQFQSVVALVIGETGSGKSTFINALTNFFKDGSFENKKYAIGISDYGQTESEFKQIKDGANQGVSQTQDCCGYEFTDSQSASTFTFIDTPGVSDTRGVDYDDKNLKKILGQIKEYDEINAILIVQNGSQARLTPNLTNALNRILGILPNEVSDNIVLVLTNSPFNTNFPVNSLEIRPKKVFLIDNSSFKKPGEFDDLNGLRDSWNKSMARIKEIAEFISTMGSFNAKCFNEVEKRVDEAKQILHEAKTKLFNLYDLKQQIEEIKMNKELKFADAQTYKDFMKTKKIDQIEWEDVAYHNTVCGNDSSLCHEHCSLEFTKDKNGSVFSKCACMGSGLKCKVCGCGADSHYHTKKIPTKTEKLVDEVLQDVKDKFTSLNAKAEELGAQEEGLEGDIKKVEMSINKAKSKLKAAILQVKKVAPRYNISGEIDNSIKVLEYDLKNTADPKKRKSIADSIRTLREFYESLKF